MKHIILIIILLGLLNSCKTDNYIIKDQNVLSNYSVLGDTIYYKKSPVAIYTHFEYELNPSHGKDSKPIVELSIRQISPVADLDELIKWIHTNHLKSKVEIVVPRKF